MRLEPCRTMLASAVPMASTRRRTVSMAAPMALLMRCCRPGSVGVMVISPPSPFCTSMSLVPVPSSALPIGCTMPRSSFSAASASSGLERRTCTALLAMPSPLVTILALRRRLRASSRNPSSQSLRTSAVSMDSSRCAPPRRSSPRLSCWCGTHHGQLCDGLLGEEIGERENHARQTRQNGRNDLPAGEMQHCASAFALQVAAAMRAAPMRSL